ncbi:sulfatase [Algisphaera agarilytica]|uniref:Arylsulfatase A-like enzyme n=1 Tax=Algisphaera agarilytica TaxID=1385975 RepID=A0A7X0H5A5_9BACT|nr:sulfatase [Algisphaera agarilytica]MBB6429388.1 arylsulfatase A-like enzyme [Algisphaera agarilytica]
MSQPNLLMILIDDLGWADLGCFGSSFYETPNLDRLAAKGLRFTDAYASAPVCSPTRAALLSGKHPARVGVTQWIGGHSVGQLQDVPYFYQLPASEKCLATALRDGGYQTWHVGKWHLGEGQCSPESHGFDVNVAGCGWGAPRHGYFSPYQCPTLSDGPEGEYLTDRITDEAIKLLENRDQDQPFFLNLWHYAVHTPIQAPAELIEKYRAKAERLGLDPEGPLEQGDHFACDHKKHLRIQRRHVQSHAAYAAMIENLDTNLGRVFDALDALGLTDDTLIVFSSDNGGLSTAEGSPTCNAPMAEGKGWMREGGNRVSQIASWPGTIAPGSETAVPVVTTDLYPTFLEAAGLPAEPLQHVDGVSLLPLLHGENAIDRDAIYWHYPHYSNQGDTPSGAVRAGRYKLIEHFEDGKLELFDLEADVSETNDISTEQPDRVASMHAQLVAWRKEVAALIPEPNPNWVPHVPGADEDPAEV